MMPITVVILAGGLGSRIGGNKGLQILRGKPLIQWVLEAVREQCAEILISANSESKEYASFGYPVVADLVPAGAGPLAGLQSALSCANNEWVACVPCDTPFLPHDLIGSLYAAIGSSDAAVAVAGGKRQPAVAIYRREVLNRLNDYLLSGQRKVANWLDLLQVREVEFEDAAAFFNINTLEDLQGCEAEP